VELELEGGHHAEVAAAAAQRPEQVRVLRLAGGQEAAVGGDHVGRQQVVAGQAVRPGEVADAAAQGEPGDAGGGHHPAGGGQAKAVGGVVEVAPGGAALHAGGTTLGVDPHPTHGGQVDDQAAVVGGEAVDVVAAAADRDEQVLLAGSVDRGDDVGGVGAAGDRRGVPVDHAVVDRSGGVVAVAGRLDQLAAQALTQPGPAGIRQFRRSCRHGDPLWDEVARSSRSGGYETGVAATTTGSAAAGAVSESTVGVK
jgi:hypothetical protein